MTRYSNVKLLAFVGLPGSGMSTAANYLRTKHFPSVYFGGVILQAMNEARLEHTAENERTFREQFRQNKGTTGVVDVIIPQIYDLIEAGQHSIVLDGLYSWDEYKALKSEFPQSLTVVALTAPRITRHRRLAIRPSRPLTNAEASQRDWSEIEQLQKGGPIAIADYFLENTGSVEELYENVEQLLDTIKFQL